MPSIRIRPTAAILGLAFGIGCGGDPSGPSGGGESTSLVVSVSTTGVRIDPDGYQIVLDAEAPRSVAANGSTTFNDVRAGTQSVRIDGLDLNCVIRSGSVVSVVAVAGQTTTVSVEVECGFLAYVRTSTEILVLETVTHSTVDTIARAAVGIAVGPRNRLLYASVDLVGTDSLLVISTDTHEVERRVALPESAGAFAISPDGQRVLLQHGGSNIPGFVSVLDLASGATLANEFMILAGISFSDFAVSADGSIVYSLSVVREIIAYDWAADQIVQRIPLSAASLQGRRMEFSPDEQTIYVMEYDGNAVNSMENVTRVNASTGQALETTPVTGDPNDMRLTPDGSEVWVTHSREPGIAIVDVATFVEVANIPDVDHPIECEFTPDGAYAYVTNRLTSEVLVVSTEAREVVERIAGLRVGGFAFAGDRR